MRHSDWVEYGHELTSNGPITGSIVALVTPMHEDGSVDYPACAS
jgi:hypothetical protein